jgi:hypothetical protein
MVDIGSSRFEMRGGSEAENEVGTRHKYDQLEQPEVIVQIQPRPVMASITPSFSIRWWNQLPSRQASTAP